jgi:single-strand DNA-binding protein
MNSVNIMGRLTRNPEVRYSQGENPVAIARYTLAVNRIGKKEEADFINIIAFGKSGEFAEKYFKQGQQVAVTGRIQTGNYTNKEGQKVYTTEVVVENQFFASSKSESNTNTNNTGKSSSNRPAPSQAVGDGFMNIPDGLDEELPFS